MGEINEIGDARPETLAAFDAVIDVRSPAEYAVDHIPGAINLPVLTDAERAEIGTIYKRRSKFGARRLGAAHAARNVAGHLVDYFADKPGAFHPLLYCWRGGMRSAAMATIIAQIGWRVGVLRGGYRTWRRGVVAGLRRDAGALPLILLDGQTGVAKSALLARLGALGVQTLDLEGRAAHRGSVFGARRSAAQPGQKMFESLLWRDLSAMNLARPILVEAESNRIGRCEIPKRLWRSMLVAPRIEIAAEPAARADYIVNTYRDFIGDDAAVGAAIEKLKTFHAKTQIEEWRRMGAEGDHRALAESLMRLHYDPRYDRARRRRGDEPLAVLTLASLDAPGLDAAAERIRSEIEKAGRPAPMRKTGGAVRRGGDARAEPYS